jgi:tRNA nucleotidyltransferase (CCA-adding enzyme)
MKIYAVGGAIRDTLMGLPMHDIDYVVVGASVDEMIAQGYRPVGKDFPVFLHPHTQAEYALARTERKTGKGYKGFMFYADPTVTLEQDLERRDLTINAMAQVVGEDGKLIGPIIDPFNGQADLASKVFRHVSDAFAEDPLRLLRIARFSARFPEFTIAPETMERLKLIVQADELAALSPERVWQELSRGLTADKPMHMLQVLLNTGAADSLLPQTLTHSLSGEAYREELLQNLQLSNHHLENRCAVLLMRLPAEEIRAWSDSIRMPKEVRDYSEIFSDLVQLIDHLKTKTDIAPLILTWFNRADVWRKPDRTFALLDLAKTVGLDISILMTALQASLAIDVSEIIAGISKESHAQGEAIGAALERARLAAISAII